VTAPPIEDGAVLVTAEGRIAAVGPHADVPTPPMVASLEFGEAVLVPGLVNCHTHLELTHFRGPTEDLVFPRWVRRIRELKEAAPDGEFVAAAEGGVRDGWTRGITCIADTGSTGAAARALATLGGRGLCYQEVFGPAPAQVEDSLQQLGAALAALQPLASPLVRLGVSPHAPYSVSEVLYRAAAAFARRARLPLAVHVAESLEETALVRDGAGPFAEALRARGIAVEARGISPVAYLHHLGVLTPDTLCIHCVQVDAGDIELLRAAGVAHCPRSNAAHHHGRSPLSALRAAGVRVGIGTDSPASVGTIDLWAEADAAGLSGSDAVRALTLDGARAVGWDREIGSLEPGKAADFAVLPDVPPAHHALLTVVAGRVVHRA
jgi:5-methylthioadenosine/S-adenosylhomocysteine deaminase